MTLFNTKMKLTTSKTNFFMYWATFSVNLLALNSSSMFSWSSPSIPILSSNDTNINPLARPITPFEESLIASLSTLGSVVGSLIAGCVAEKLGRKKTLIIFGTPIFFGYLILANASHVILFFIARFSIGLGAGSVFALLPSYVGEISEDTNRGTAGSIFGIMNGIGHFLSYGIGPLVSLRTFAYILMIPVTLFFVTFIPFIPESPYHFLAKNDIKQAEKSLKQIRQNGNVEKELYYLKGVVKETMDNKVSWKVMISSVATRKGLIICCGLFVLQQALGIAVILLYLQSILDTGGNIFPSYMASIIIAITQIVACILSTIVIDLIGRKLLLHISAIGSSLSMFGLGTYFLLYDKQYNLDAVFWLPTASLIAYYMFFSVGFAIIPWTICGELFAPNVKSLCASIASFVCLVSSFLFGLCFPLVRNILGMGGIFYFFCCMGIVSSIFVALFVPETKGKSLLEIQYELNGKLKKDNDEALESDES